MADDFFNYLIYDNFSIIHCSKHSCSVIMLFLTIRCMYNDIVLRSLTNLKNLKNSHPRTELSCWCNVVERSFTR